MAIRLKPRSTSKGGWVENGPAVERALRDMARNIGPEKARTRLTRVLRAAAKPMLPELRSLTPVLSGDLRKSAGIRVLPARARSLFPGRVVAAVGVGYWWPKKKHLAFRARSIVHGNLTYRRAAKKPIRRAFAASCGAIQAELNSGFRKFVTDAMKAGAAGKGGVKLRGTVNARKGKPARMARPSRGAL